MDRYAVQIVPLATASLLALVGLSSTAGRAAAEPVVPAFIVTDTDWTSAAVGGIGGGSRQGGTGTIALSGVTGSVKQAFLYWHGIDNFTPRTAGARLDAGAWAGGRMGGAVPKPVHAATCDGVFDVATVFFNGRPVTGDPIGDSDTNCWGEGSSRAFRADVTADVAGDGLYSVQLVASDECDDMNGASLVVLFNDGEPENNRDLVFCEGNDSNFFFNFPGESDGWHATLEGILYSSGKAAIQLHVADGQDLSGNGLEDGELLVSATGGPSLFIPDASGLWDGSSVPSAGTGRSEALDIPGALWDVHTFDISPLFPAPGAYTLALDGQENLADCTGLVLAIVDVRTGALVSTHAATWGQVKSIFR